MLFGLAVLVIDMTGLIVDNTGFCSAETAIENDLAVILAVAFRNAELVDRIIARCKRSNRIERAAGGRTVVLIACGVVGIGVGMYRTVFRTRRRNARSG